MEIEKVTRKITIELPTATERFLNKVIQDNPWLGTIEDILWDALRAKMTRLHALGKMET